MPQGTLAPPPLNATDDEPPYDGVVDDGGQDGGDRGPWVTVATFWQPMDAHLARIKLESLDIDCVLLDEFLVATDWLYANAVGGIKLQVPASRADEAREALERPVALDEADGAMPATSHDPDAPLAYASSVSKCPACGSMKTHPMRWSRRSVFVTILLLGFPLPFLSRRWECDECGTEWDPGARPATVD